MEAKTLERRGIHRQRGDHEQRQLAGTDGRETKHGQPGEPNSSTCEASPPMDVRRPQSYSNTRSWSATRSCPEAFDEELTEALSPMQSCLINHFLTYRCSVDASIHDIAAKLEQTLAEAQRTL